MNIHKHEQERVEIMATAINSIQFFSSPYLSEEIRKEDVKEQSSTTVTNQSQKDQPSSEGFSSTGGFVQTNGIVFDILRNSFFSQMGINISYSAPVLSLHGISSSAKEQLTKISSEMVNLQSELTTLIASASELAGLDSSDEKIKEYPTKYIELYNKLADKKAEYDSFIAKNNISSEDAKTLCKDAYDKYSSKDKEIVDKYTEVDNKKNLNGYNVKMLTDVDMEDPSVVQMQAKDQVYALELTSLKQQYAIAGLDLFSSDTKLEKLSTDDANLVVKFQEIKEQRQILSYQTAALVADKNDTSFKELQKKDQELMEQQKEIAEKLKSQTNNNYNSTAYNLLLAPQKMSATLQVSDLEYKITNIENKRQTISEKLASSSKLSKKEKNQLKATDQVYDLELTSLKTQLAEINGSDSTSNIVKIDDSLMKKLYEPQKQDITLVRDDLTKKLDEIKVKLDDIAKQSKTVKTKKDKESLTATKQVYELEQTELKAQLEEIDKIYQYIK